MTGSDSQSSAPLGHLWISWTFLQGLSQPPIILGLFALKLPVADFVWMLLVRVRDVLSAFGYLERCTFVRSSYPGFRKTPFPISSPQSVGVYHDLKTDCPACPSPFQLPTGGKKWQGVVW